MQVLGGKDVTETGSVWRELEEAVGMEAMAPLREVGECHKSRIARGAGARRVGRTEKKVKGD